jgi:hypothetical protein
MSTRQSTVQTRGYYAECYSATAHCFLVTTRRKLLTQQHVVVHHAGLDHHHLPLPATRLSSLPSGLSKSLKLVLPSSAPSHLLCHRVLVHDDDLPQEPLSHLTLATS